jgi:hypothetical protein
MSANLNESSSNLPKFEEDSMRVTLQMGDEAEKEKRRFGNPHDIVIERLKSMNPL